MTSAPPSTAVVVTAAINVMRVLLGLIGASSGYATSGLYGFIILPHLIVKKVFGRFDLLSQARFEQPSERERNGQCERSDDDDRRYHQLPPSNRLRT